eukprot:scaffold15425_cov62-Attheya_sp.AAC.4
MVGDNQPFGGREIKKELFVGAIAIAVAAAQSLAGKLATEDEASHIDVEAGVVVEPASEIRGLVAGIVTGLTSMACGLLVGFALASRSRRPWFLGNCV